MYVSGCVTVSYTHLDVYKRQVVMCYISISILCFLNFFCLQAWPSIVFLLILLCLFRYVFFFLLGGKIIQKVVLYLLENLTDYGHGHAVYMDNYYNSFSLTSKLMSKATYCTGKFNADRNCGTTCWQTCGW